jgi:hypothetical protein
VNGALEWSRFQGHLVWSVRFAPAWARRGWLLGMVAHREQRTGSWAYIGLFVVPPIPARPRQPHSRSDLPGARFAVVGEGNPQGGAVEVLGIEPQHGPPSIPPERGSRSRTFWLR